VTDTCALDLSERSALRASRTLTPKRYSGTPFCDRQSQCQVHSAAGSIRSIENKSVTSWGIEPATFRRAVWRFTYLEYRVPSLFVVEVELSSALERVLYCCCVAVAGVAGLDLTLEFTHEPQDVVAVRSKPLVLHCAVSNSAPGPVNITWTHEGEPVPLVNDSRRYLLPNGSLYFRKVSSAPHAGNP
jgi:hypothetical protein